MSASADVVCVPTPAVALVWPLVSHLIKSAMVRSDMGAFADVENDVLQGNALLWLVYTGTDVDAAGVTKLTATSTTKVCTIVACGGTGSRRWVHLLTKIEDYAKAEGCDVTRIIGRRGWERLLPDYRATRIILERQL